MTRDVMRTLELRRHVTRGAGVTLLALVASLAAVPTSLAAAPACTVWGTAGNDEWTVRRTPEGPREIPPGAVVCGGAGNDRLHTPGAPFRGTFVGGAGRDDIGLIAGHGAFLGGRGRDGIRVMRGGLFRGGPGADRVGTIEGGEFFGGPGVDGTSIRVIDLAREDLAIRSTVASERVLLVSVVFVPWSDTSLGCPEEGRFYAQAVTPGYRVRLAAGGAVHVYHTDTSTQVVLVGGSTCQGQDAS